MRKLVLAASVFVFTSGVAFAGKPHREAAKEFGPKSKEATETVKSGCGCAPAFVWDMKSFEQTPNDKVSDYSNNIKQEFADLAKTAKEFCNDATSKKIFCSKVKKFQIFTKTTGDDADTKYANGVFSITTTHQMASGGYAMKSEMEKW
jgi:hypothetical protein